MKCGIVALEIHDPSMKFSDKIYYRYSIRGAQHDGVHTCLDHIEDINTYSTCYLEKNRPNSLVQ